MSNNPSKERIVVLEILESAFNGKKIDRCFASYRSLSDLRFNQVYNLVNGVARRHFMLEAYVSSKVKKQPPLLIKLILEIGLYELSFNSSAKNYAVVSDCLKLAEHKKLPKFKGLINAILRRFLKEDDLPTMLKYPTYPKWFLGQIPRVLKNDVDKIVSDFMKESPFFLVVNTLVTDADKLCEAMKEKGIDIACEGNRLSTSDSRILSTDEFKDGCFFIQDFSAQHAVELLDVYNGMKMLDVCAAPGGKSVKASIVVGDNNTEIQAMDLSDARLVRVYENINRMKIKSIKVINADLLEYDFKGQTYDRIIVDPPCSALGVIGRHPDVLWNKSVRLINELSELQYKLLYKSLELLKTGGKLVYSVCTFTEKETINVIDKVLKDFDDVKVTEHTLTIPNDIGMDGHFIAVLEKK